MLVAHHGGVGGASGRVFTLEMLAELLQLRKLFLPGLSCLGRGVLECQGSLLSPLYYIVSSAVFAFDGGVPPGPVPSLDVEHILDIGG